MKGVLIVSTAHEVVLATKTDQFGATKACDDFYYCVRCEVKGSLRRLFPRPGDKLSWRCTPHYELETSGWTHDDRFEKVFRNGAQWTTVLCSDESEHDPTLST